MMILKKARIGVLTSSRADFGIYLPLLNAIKNDSDIDLHIVAFGTHLSDFHGKTSVQIVEAGFEMEWQIESMLLTDSETAVATSIGLTTIKFAEFWKEHREDFDLVLCLGDRYEMFSAVIAGISFGIRFGHFHGGEKTTGAIDNVFRHCISHASFIHFASTEDYADRLRGMLDDSSRIHNVGAISLENLHSIRLLSNFEFEEKWGVDLSRKTILLTFHPETISVKSNVYYAEELVKIIVANENYQYLITMPNADTDGNVIRKIFIERLSDLANVFLIENLGTQSYFTAMNNCFFMLGNTSSGIIEAASFKKYVINLGMRQDGRTCSQNVIQTNIDYAAITKSIQEIEKNNVYTGTNIYFKENSISLVLNELKKLCTK